MDIIEDIKGRAQQAMAKHVGLPTEDSYEAMAREVAEQYARHHRTTVRDFTWRLEGTMLHVDVGLDLPPDTPIDVIISRTATEDDDG